MLTLAALLCKVYMNGFKCNVTGSTSNTPIGQPALARR